MNTSALIKIILVGAAGYLVYTWWQGGGSSLFGIAPTTTPTTGTTTGTQTGTITTPVTTTPAPTSTLGNQLLNRAGLNSSGTLGVDQWNFYLSHIYPLAQVTDLGVQRDSNGNSPQMTVAQYMQLRQQAGLPDPSMGLSGLWGHPPLGNMAHLRWRN